MSVDASRRPRASDFGAVAGTAAATDCSMTDARCAASRATADASRRRCSASLRAMIAACAASARVLATASRRAASPRAWSRAASVDASFLRFLASAVIASFADSERSDASRVICRSCLRRRVAAPPRPTRG